MIYELFGAQGIIYDSNKRKILLAKRIRDEYWVIPGGAIEKGETPEEATIRETKEETGLNVKIIEKLGDYYRPECSTFGKKGDHTQVFLCRKISGKFLKNEETSEIKFFNIYKLPDKVLPWHIERIKDAINFKGRQFFRIQYYSNR